MCVFVQRAYQYYNPVLEYNNVFYVHLCIFIDRKLSLKMQCKPHKSHIRTNTAIEAIFAFSFLKAIQKFKNWTEVLSWNHFNWTHTWHTWCIHSISHRIPYIKHENGIHLFDFVNSLDFTFFIFSFNKNLQENLSILRFNEKLIGISTTNNR